MITEDFDKKMAYDLSVEFRSADAASETSQIQLRQDNAPQEDSVIVLAIHQLPALITELQRIYDLETKSSATTGAL